MGEALLNKIRTRLVRIIIKLLASIKEVTVGERMKDIPNQRRKRIAWQNYYKAMKGVPSSAPHYSTLERRAWSVLQNQLKTLR